jgi:hypothetical protein
MRYSSGRLQLPSDNKDARGDEEEWIDHLGDRAWINWARAVLPRSCKDRHDQGCDVDARRVEAQRGGVTRPAPAGLGPFFEGSGGWCVERSLYQRANGYNYDAVKVFMPAGAKQPVIVHYTEHCPPDVGAAFIWLKNRDPERWRDVQNVEHVLGKYIISDKPMTIEQWAAERATVINEVIDDTKELPAPPKGAT